MLDKARVLIVEDDEGIRMTLEDLLAGEGSVVDSRADGPSGEAAARSGAYDLILLDLMLPGRDGLEVCRSLRGSSIATPIVMLSARGSNLDVVAGFREGADDYVPKPFDGSVLVARIEAVLRRSGPAGRGRKPDESRFGEFRLDRRRGELSRNGTPVPLNAQEYRLLDFLAANPGRVIGRDEILDLAWDYDSETTTRTIDVHVAKLRQRLGESELPKHILTVRGKGYKFVV
jgi:two-component system, OmpR family, alkaline phosphatase synthesis response regulator PhoP